MLCKAEPKSGAGGQASLPSTATWQRCLGKSVLFADLSLSPPWPPGLGADQPQPTGWPRHVFLCIYGIQFGAVYEGRTALTTFWRLAVLEATQAQGDAAGWRFQHLSTPRTV